MTNNTTNTNASNNASIQVRIDQETKQNADVLFQSLGLDTSTAVRMFLKQAVMRQELPFDVSLPGFYNEYNQSVLKESISQLEKGKSQQHELVE